MNLEEIPKLYATVSEIAADLGVPLATVYNWLKYHRILPYDGSIGRPLILRTDYAAFKEAHADVIREAQEKHAAKQAA